MIENRIVFVLSIALLILTSATQVSYGSPGVIKVENRGLLFTNNQAGVTGVDGGYSTPMGNKTLWFFGDVFLLNPTSPTQAYVGGVTNCGLLTDAGKGAAPLSHYRFFTDPKTGVARQLIPYLQGEDNSLRMWPFGGWYDPSTKRVWIFYDLVRTNSSGGPLGFTTLGMGLATANAKNPEQLHFERLVPKKGDASNPLRIWWNNATGPIFGEAIFTSPEKSDPYLYIVGSQMIKGVQTGYMARVRRNRIGDIGSYEYFSGTAQAPAWSSDVSKAAPVEGLTDFPTELSVSYNRYLGAYLAVHSHNLDEKLDLCIAPHPWGPYHTFAQIKAPHRAFSQAFCYAGKEHPELSKDGGRVIYVTYVDSERYWLQLYRVTLTH